MSISDKQPEAENTNDSSTPLFAADLLKYRRAIIIGSHIVAFAFSLLLSFLLTSNMQFRSEWLLQQYPQLLAAFIVIKLVVFGMFKQFRGWWRYVGISDLISIGKASLVSTLIIVLMWFGMMNAPGLRRTMASLADISQGVFVLDMFFTILLLGGLRMLVRLYHEEFRREESGHLKRFLIIGAGNAGEALLREIHRMSVAQYEVIGFVDDDLAKQGMSIHDIPVLGRVDELPGICKEKEIEEIAIAIPSATHQQLRHVIQVCQGTKIRFRTVPSITDIASGRLGHISLSRRFFPRFLSHFQATSDA